MAYHNRSFPGFACVTMMLMLLATVVVVHAATVDNYIKDLKAGPTIYYTPEAAAYFAALGNYTTTGLSVNKDAAVRTFTATTKLGSMQLSMAKDAINTLIDLFPKAVHVVQIPQAKYTGKGSYDDCVSTYVMSAKNQFMTSCPFLDYNSLSLCEQFIESTKETEMLSSRKGKKGAIIEAMFNLRITFTFYAAECALSRLTGMSLGHDPNAWRQWWLSSTRAPFTPASDYTTVATTSTGTYVTENSYSDIEPGGTYRIILKTGDDLTGTVESRSDTSLVLETTDGKPYSFKFSLMQSYQVIERPAPKKVTSSDGKMKAEMLTYEQLQERAAGKPDIEVTLNNGSHFKGRLTTINDEELSLAVEGSSIPIAKNVIKQIIFIPPGQKQPKKDTTAQKPQGPFDTLYVKNPKKDKYGKAEADLLYAGTIIDEGDNYVTMQFIQGGEPKKFSRDEINRFIRHSKAKGTDAIKKYAQTLSCPPDMFLVDMPPGRSGKPFFKVCMDKYEYPNKSGTMPRTKLTFGQAKKLCEKQGKRLCTTTEWMWACGGLNGLPYPYGKNFEKDRCNTDTRYTETSGNRINCVSPFGGYDMSGNLFEWVVTERGGMALMGGPVSKCQTVAEVTSGDAKPHSGVRCCKGN
ncbi:MAG: SUMF1/EgtB/PvdO family nonheme iron enzyme [Chitinispirillaceae bacterium]|nr:SUMF1/EgtB/PvdO family nonheme iron enzyme [Chitinispirillaceae bacterium]